MSGDGGDAHLYHCRAPISSCWSMNRRFYFFYRRLEKGAFEVPAFDLDVRSMQITCDQLHFILKGISLKEIKYRKRYQHQQAIS
jgi:hypothetical protein